MISSARRRRNKRERERERERERKNRSCGIRARGRFLGMAHSGNKKKMKKQAISMHVSKFIVQRLKKLIINKTDQGS